MDEQGLQTAIAVIQEKIHNIFEIVQGIKKDLEKKYITRQEFDPVKKIVYGLVGAILLGVTGTILAMVLQR
ncbi:TPA: hypothetical protein DCX15_01205 [bacterium]|nr:hypothetical protein [bacterium]